MKTTEVIHAAGGLVWRERLREREIAIVRRVRYGTEWTLPKGKLQDGETWEAAAVREVGEETGCQVTRGLFAGGQIYQVNNRPKVVLYWHMVVIHEGPLAEQEEIAELAWVTPAEAHTRLTHPAERSLVPG